MAKQYRSSGGSEKGDTTPIATKMGPLDSNSQRQSEVRTSQKEGDQIVGDFDFLGVISAALKTVGLKHSDDGDKAKKATSVSKGEWGALFPKDKLSSYPVEDGGQIKVLEVDGETLTVESKEGKKSFEIQLSEFSPKPEIVVDEKSGEHHDVRWTEFDPVKMDSFTVDDIAQGAIGDCYLIAAIGSIVAGNPKFMEEAMRYDSSSNMYQVRFFEEIGPDKNGDAVFEPVWISVDGYLPTQGGDLHYGKAAKGAATWAAFMEKAYAVWKGGYQAIGHGGTLDSSLSAISGQESAHFRTTGMTEEEVLQTLRESQTGGYALSVGTPGDSDKRERGMLKGGFGGRLKGTLSPGAKVDEGSVRLMNSVSQMGDEVYRATDKDGKLSGSLGEGKIDYEKGGKVNLKLDKEAKAVPAEDVVGNWSESFRDTKFNLYGGHAYVFTGVNDANEVTLKNPWGTEHPSPIPIADFLKIFSYMDRVKIPGM